MRGEDMRGWDLKGQDMSGYERSGRGLGQGVIERLRDWMISDLIRLDYIILDCIRLGKMRSHNMKAGGNM